MERANFCIEVKTAHKTGRNLNRAFYIWKFGHWRQSGQNQGPKKYQKQHYMLVNIIPVITRGNCGKKWIYMGGGGPPRFQPKKIKFCVVGGVVCQIFGILKFYSIRSKFLIPAAPWDEAYLNSKAQILKIM